MVPALPSMEAERTIAEIERIFAAPDIRHSAQPTSLRGIEGMTKCSRRVHGSGFGSISGFAAEGCSARIPAWPPSR